MTFSIIQVDDRDGDKSGDESWGNQGHLGNTGLRRTLGGDGAFPLFLGHGCPRSGGFQLDNLLFPWAASLIFLALAR